jgi:hypothetical protein
VGEWLVEPKQNRLVRGKESKHLDAMAIRVLSFLAEHPNEILTIEQIFSSDEVSDAIWGLPDELPVDVSSVSHSDDIDDEPLVFDGIYDSVVALPQTVFLFAGELLRTRWARLVCEPLNSPNDSTPVARAVDRFDFLDGGRLDEDLISCHAS